MGRAAWPPARCVAEDGWLLCESGGFSRRANSVHPIADGSGALAERIERCEAFYRECGLRPVFKLTAAARPEGLEGVLAARGYAQADPTCVEVRGLAGGAHAVPQSGLVLERHPSDGWLERCLTLRDLDEDAAASYRSTLDRIAGHAEPCAFATLRSGGDEHAQGLAVVRGEDVVLEEIATSPSARRRGLARAVVQGLLAWTAEQGASRVVLQVVAANTPARALYHDLGFAEVYRYWYREAPVG